jgi:hypothetical protein
MPSNLDSVADNCNSPENQQKKFLALIASKLAERECRINKLANDHNISNREQLRMTIFNASWTLGRSEMSILNSVPDDLPKVAKSLDGILKMFSRSAQPPKGVDAVTNRSLLSEINVTALIPALVNLRHPHVPVHIDGKLNPEWESYFEEKAQEVDRWLVMTREIMWAAYKHPENPKGGASS